MHNLHHQRTIDAKAVFANRFLDSKMLYLYRFSQIPSLHFFESIDGEAAYKAFKKTFAELIVSEYQYRWYKKEKKKYHFDETVFVLRN